MSNRTKVIGEVVERLEYQDQKWGREADDTKNTPNDWNSFISHYGTRWFTGGFAPYKKAGVDAFRKAMLDVAALAISAVESLDRQAANNGKPFYQED